jgi:hypothetical protein
LVAAASGGGAIPKDLPPPHNLMIKWAGKEIEIEDINGLKTVRDLKQMIQHKTGVQPDRQKLLNLNFKGMYVIYMQDAGLDGTNKSYTSLDE